MVAERIRSIGLSPTLRISALAADMRRRGEDVLDFSAGQPDFPTPEEVKVAGVQAIEADQTRYTANEGLIELRDAIARRLRDDRGLDYDAAQIVVSPGAKASLFFACMTLLDPQDEVLVPSPYWVSYPEQIALAGARSVLVPCDERRGFRLRVEDLERACTDRTRALLLNYPSNPTGASYERAELEALADLCLRRSLWVIADEIYSGLLYDGRSFTSIAAVNPEMQRRTVLIDGMSKSYSMTGWRIGYAAGPREIIAGMSRLQSHVTSNATSISQWASIRALEMPAEQLRRRVRAFQDRRDEVVRRLCALEGVVCTRPEGAFYVFPNVSHYFGRTWESGEIRCGGDLAAYLLERAQVAVVPGEAFGSEQHVRISYATSLECIGEGLDRVQRALAEL